ncbi:MAG: potassium-transporting ATPase subunit F [Deltaproteobacteria bacterium]|nr:potassium-transporting ATPase subunit F [Deltaproteobacteria bacterium]
MIAHAAFLGVTLLFFGLSVFYESLREVYIVLEIVVGLIGVVLIVYLLVTILRPELF